MRKILLTICLFGVPALAQQDQVPTSKSLETKELREPAQSPKDKKPARQKAKKKDDDKISKSGADKPVFDQKPE